MSQQFDGDYQVVGEHQQVAQPHVAQGQLVPINWTTRLAYDDKLDRDYKITQDAWASLCDSIFPGVNNPNSIIMALRYCRARNLDIFKRPISIVPMWRKIDGPRERGKPKGRMVDTIWPGIMEVRTTAMRTGECAGIDNCEWGDDLAMTFEYKDSGDDGITKVERLHLVFPRWARYAVRRVIKSKERTFAGPQVFWLETYAQQSRWSEIPNAMWEKRPRGQLDKCAEAAGWRRAFPEELPGGGYIGDEMEGKEITTEVSEIQTLSEDNTNQLIERQSLEAKGTKSTGWRQDTGSPRDSRENAPSASDTGQHSPPGSQHHDKPSIGSAAAGAPEPAGSAPKPPAVPKREPPKVGSDEHMDAHQYGTTEARPADSGPPHPPQTSQPTLPPAADTPSGQAASGPPRPPPRPASTPAPTSAAESPSPTPKAPPPAQTAAPSSSSPTTNNFGAPRPPKQSRSMSTTATAPAADAGSGSPSYGRTGIDPRQAWIAARPNFAGNFNEVEQWVRRLYEMATDHDDLNELMLRHVDAHIDAIFPQDRDTLHGLFNEAERRFEP